MSCAVANGVFDCFHGGHFRFLFWCWYHTAIPANLPFIVGIDSDQKVKKDKGNYRPYFSQEERRGHVIATGMVDDVFFFDTNQELEEKIKELHPEYLIKGVGWKNNVVGEKYAKQVKFFDGKTPDISTSEIEKRIETKWARESS